MNIDCLRVSNLRCFERAEFAPGPGINWLVGTNGAGKTTLLEAAYILSHGRSFRSGSRSAARRHGAKEYLIHAEVSRLRSFRHKLGITRNDVGWRARLDGADLTTLAPLFAACPVISFGPESPSLILGASEERRSFLDWSVFHVEHESVTLWRRWRRALRQRNALLREGAADASFEPWERELAQLGRCINGMREECLAGIEPFLVEEAAGLIPELGRARIRYRTGWNDDMGLGNHLSASRASDRERGFTQIGVHRADWALQFERVARREHLSRGQAKAAAMVCLLAQARWLNSHLGEHPLLCLDDLQSELDREHATKVITWLTERPIQAWITTTNEPITFGASGGSMVFHVEQRGPVLHAKPIQSGVHDPL